jgi:hypothetical protein
VIKDTAHLRVVPHKRSQPLPGRLLSPDEAAVIHERVIRENRVLDEVLRTRAHWVEALGDYYSTPQQWLPHLVGRVGKAADQIANLETTPGRHLQHALEAQAALLVTAALALEIHDRLAQFAQAHVPGPD